MFSIRKAIFIVGCVLFVFRSHAQTHTSTLRATADAVAGYHDFYASEYRNYGAVESINAFVQPGVSPFGGINAGRIFIRFDLQAIPANARVVSAYLRLYGNGPFGNGAAAAVGNMGNNEARVARVIEDWDETTLTWRTQPVAASENVAMIGRVENVFGQIAVDVTELLREMLYRPLESYGFSIALVNEVPTAALSFRSRETPVTAERPALIVAWEMPEPVALRNNKSVGESQPDEASLGDLSASSIHRRVDGEANVFAPVLYPNPVDRLLHVRASAFDSGNVRVFDALGREIICQRIAADFFTVDVSALSAGVYFLQSGSYGMRFVKN